MDSMGGLLTRGLGAPACCGLILAQFNLAKCCQYTITTSNPQYDGGSKPLAPGEIANFYTPVSGGKTTNPLKPLDYLQPYNPPQPVEKITITLTIRDGDTITKEYFVPKYKSKIIVNIVRFVASSFGFVSVTALNLRNRLMKKVRVVVDNLRKQ